MNVVGKVGSLISQGVYSVATPFHPFGGAVDVIVVEQQDGSYRSTPWYVRFGKFQGVLKGTEKMVRIAVNGVEANFHMYLDNSGEAYFIREVVSRKDDEAKISGNLEARLDDNVDNSINGDTSVTICRSESEVSNTGEVQLSDDRVSLSPDQLENIEIGDESRIYEFEDQQPSRSDPTESPDYRAYYERLDQVEDVVEAQASGSEVVLFSVDGHVITAPISSALENTDDVQLCTPQFHLGPGEGADFNGDNDELGVGQETWTADFGDLEVSVPDNASEEYSKTLKVISDSEKFDLEVEKFSENNDSEAVNQAPETCKIERIESHSSEHNNNSEALVYMNKEDLYKSCLEFTNLHGHVEDGESHGLGSPRTEVGPKEDIGESQQNSPLSVSAKKNIGESQLNSPSSIRSVEESKDEGDLMFENSATSSSHNFDSPHTLPLLGIEAEASDSVSLHSVCNDPEWKDEHFDLADSTHGVESPGRSAPEEECSRSDLVEPVTGSSDVGIRSSTGMGFEISLCGHLLHAGMGLGPAGEAFEAFLISEEEFKISASSIVKEENLIVRYKGKYFPWGKAAHLVLGMAAFGLDLLAETKDAILVELDEAPKASPATPEFTSTPSGRRWRLWPIAFRRVKTLEHTTSTSSNDDIFVDSDSGSQNPRIETPSTPSAHVESPKKKFVRTNIPTTDQIAELNLKDGQNMITFSYSTRVLGTQQVEAHIYLWKWNARIVISDVDGTITKSDVLGQFMPLVGKDWTQSGVARLFSAIKENGYQLLFLSARAIVQAYLTKSFLLNIKQDGNTLPNGPVVISPDGLFPSLYREVIRRAPHEFKIACLEDIKALFPSDYNPFYAGFGNRDTDELSYRKVGIPKGKIFIINPKGEVAISHRIGVKSYTSLHTLVNDMFPPTSMIEQEDYNAWNFWKVPLPSIEL